MRIPQLTELPTTKDMIEEFGGYNHNMRIGTGEWYDQKNMSCDNYPVAGTRKKRARQYLLKKLTRIIDRGFITDQFDMEGFLGMEYTGEKLVSLQPVYNGSQQVGCWFSSDEKVTEINSTTSNNVVITITEQISGAYKYSVTVRIPKIGLDISVDNIIRVVFGTHQIAPKVTNVTEDTQNEYTEFVGKYGDRGVVFGNTDDDTAYSGTYTATLLNLTKQYDIAYYHNIFDKNTNQRGFVRMASYLCTFPDGVVYETNNKTDEVPFFKIEESLTLEKAVDGDKTSTIYVGLAVKTDNGYDMSFGSGNNFNPDKWRIEDGKLQEYLTDDKMWVGRQAYTLFYYGKGNDSSGPYTPSYTFGRLKKGDTITIKVNDAVNSNNKLMGILGEKDGAYQEKSLTIVDTGKWANGDRPYIVVEGVSYAEVESVQKRIYEANSVTFTRKFPQVTNLVCESQNRLWSCSADGHEIYASALGDPYNFYTYQGDANDSYAVNVGTAGVFTGCINFRGNPIFFKEHTAHIITGSYPTNGGVLDGGSYAVSEIPLLGVERGSERSLAIIDNILYYKSTLGIVAFDGTNATLISDSLGNKKYHNAVAGAFCSKLYISMLDADESPQMFVYDTKKGVWCKENNTRALQCINIRNRLLFATPTEIDCATEENLFASVNYLVESDFDWMAETGTIGYSYPNNKYLSRFQIRMSLDEGASAKIFVQYDSDGVWHKAGDMTSKGTKTYLIPIVPRRCDHLKFKFEGVGGAKIISFARILEEGGDV